MNEWQRVLFLKREIICIIKLLLLLLILLNIINIIKFFLSVRCLCNKQNNKGCLEIWNFSSRVQLDISRVSAANENKPT